MKHLIFTITFAGLIAFGQTAQADENATIGGLLNSESVFLGAGPFDHGAALGDATNSTTTAFFTGGFTATHVRFAGNLTEVDPGTWGNEADIQITSPAVPPLLSGTPFVWESTGPAGTYTGPLAFDSSQELAAAFPTGVDPNGTWDLEFFDTFDDAAGAADQQSSDVTMTFEENAISIDTDGLFAFADLAVGDADNSVGEFVFENMFDSYDITLTEDGFLNFATAANAGLTGNDFDTEIAIFDSAGILVATNDDNATPGDLHSELNTLLSAGDYTLVVGGFDTVFADGNSVTAGVGNGDYGVTVSLAAVPEPSTAIVLALGMIGCGLRRRRS